MDGRPTKKDLEGWIAEVLRPATLRRFIQNRDTVNNCVVLDYLEVAFAGLWPNGTMVCTVWGLVLHDVTPSRAQDAQQGISARFPVWAESTFLHYRYGGDEEARRNRIDYLDKIMEMERAEFTAMMQKLGEGA